MKQLVKKLACNTLLLSGCAHLGRYRNRGKVLVVMYHGVTRNLQDDPIWTQLPVDVFEAQLDFFQRWYHPLSLSDFIKAMKGEEKFPENALLITFDDGLKNNYTIAYPILRARKMPAVIFLTTDYIGTDRILWADELYLLVKSADETGRRIPPAFSKYLGRTTTVWEQYVMLIEHFKRMPDHEREQAMISLRSAVPLIKNHYNNDFSLLDWQEVAAMNSDALMDFGVHTATHKILSRIPPEEWEREIVQPKAILEQKLQREVVSFCYPNGRSGLDYYGQHKQILRTAGYHCAFSTDHGLHVMGDEPYAIKRIPAGNDMTSYPAYFQLACAGIL